MDVTRPTRSTPAPAEPQITLLAADYSPAILDGQVLAVPLRPAAYDGTEFVPALIDGQVAAVPVHNPLAALTAQQQSVPAAQPAPVVDPGLPRAVQQSILLGSLGAVSLGALVLMSGAGAGLLAANADALNELLMWICATIVAVAVGVLLLLGKVKAIRRSGGTGSATATGANANAGTVFALNYRPEQHTTNIGRQTAIGGRGITNNNG